MFIPIIFAVLLTHGISQQADRFRVIADESIIAVVTHRGGIASSLAHNHLISARAYEIDLAYDESNPSLTSFSGTLPVAKFAVDDSIDRQQWERRLDELAVEDNLGKPGENDIRKIRLAMLSKGQLNAEKYPDVTFSLESIVNVDTSVGSHPFEYLSKVVLSIRDVQLVVALPVNISLSSDTLRVEGVGVSSFRSFGIDPYSTAFGAARNRDEIHFYLNLTAVRESENG